MKKNKKKNVERTKVKKSSKKSKKLIKKVERIEGSKKFKPSRHLSRRKRVLSKQDGGSIFEALFGPIPKTRLINLFFRNENVIFSAIELSKRTKLGTAVINKECNALAEAGILVRHGSGSARSYKLNISFPFLAEFQNLVQRSFPIGKSKLINTVKRAGRLRLVLVSGLFLNRNDSQVDLFIVADNLSEKRLESSIKEIEVLMGKELRWVGMGTEEFLYRWRMFDRFVHDLLAAPHEKILVNKLNLV